MKKERQLILNKTNGRCAYCGCDLNGLKWHADHFEPVRRKQRYVKAQWDGEVLISGKWVADGFRHPERDSEDNKMAACASCNIMKSDRDLESFRKLISDFINSLNSYSTQYKFAKRFGLIEEKPIQVKFYFETLKKCDGKCGDNYCDEYGCVENKPDNPTLIPSIS